MNGFIEHLDLPLPVVTYRPRGEAPASGWPTILFLHGMGESGTDGLRQLIHGPSTRVIRERDKWPFAIVFPQKPEAAKAWFDYHDELNDVLTALEPDLHSDPHRRYITGLSQGGRGTFELAGDLVWRFAAAAPICGWNERPNLADRLRDIPVWAFHGEDDPVVPVSATIEAVKELEAAGAEVKSTIYPDTQHDSWTKAYAEPELPQWFLSHRLD